MHFEVEADRRQVRLTSHLIQDGRNPASPPVRLQGDPALLERALSNLVDNALRYTPAGGEIRLEVRPDGFEGPARTCGREGQGAYLLFTVRGCGIAPEHLPYVFERFYRADNSRRRDGSGSTGLGLAIARQIVQAHDGQIWIDSTPDKGTAVYVRLPVS